MAEKLPQPTRRLIARLRRAATGLDKMKADLSNPLGMYVKPEALSAYANTCWQSAGRLEELLNELLERIGEDPIQRSAKRESNV